MRIKIKVSDIKNRASKQSFICGKEYYRRGAISAAVQRGDEIEASCAGSRPVPYHVSAILSNTGNIEQAYWTCAYDFPGDCKHVVALLLTYCHQPELFDEVRPVHEQLAERSKEELIALIQEMVAIYRQLVSLVDRPMPRPTAEGETAAMVDLAPLQRQLRQGLGPSRTLQYAVATVQSVARVATDFANARQWHNASAIYRAIIEEVTSLDHYPSVEDYDYADDYDDYEEYDDYDDDANLEWELHLVVKEILTCLDQPEIKNDERERNALLERS